MLKKRRVLANSGGIYSFGKLKKRNIYLKKLTGSTNKDALEYISCNRELPCLFIAQAQSLGRGRFDRVFNSERGGLYMSLGFIPSPGCDSGKITAAAGVAVCNAIKRLAGISPGIKWVNDVLINGGKLAGILAEGKVDDGAGLSYAVLGIGVNVLDRPFPDELSKIAKSIEGACGKRLNIYTLAGEILKELSVLLEAPSLTMEKYREYSLVIGRDVLVHGTREYTAHVIDINGSGELVVRDENGQIQSLSSGEISIKLG